METVVRHRLPAVDQYGKRAGGSSDASVIVREVEPLSGAEVVRQVVGGKTRTFTCRLYTLTPVDVADGDELTVRGTRYRFVSVSEWRATGSRFSGYVILCGGGDG